MYFRTTKSYRRTTYWLVHGRLPEATLGLRTIVGLGLCERLALEISVSERCIILVGHGPYVSCSFSPNVGIELIV